MLCCSCLRSAALCQWSRLHVQTKTDERRGLSATLFYLDSCFFCLPNLAHFLSSLNDCVITKWKQHSQFPDRKMKQQIFASGHVKPLASDSVGWEKAGIYSYLPSSSLGCIIAVTFGISTLPLNIFSLILTLQFQAQVIRKGPFSMLKKLVRLQAGTVLCSAHCFSHRWPSRCVPHLQRQSRHCINLIGIFCACIFIKFTTFCLALSTW